MILKTCPKCKKELSLDSFHKRGDGHGDGHFSHCKDCENARGREKYHRTIEKQRLRGRLKSQRYKMTVLDHYGHMCQCCGETEDAFLAIDHINNDGGEFRKANKGIGVFVWIIKNNFPTNLQTLCFNCNWAKTRYGLCPHKSKELVI